MNAASRPRFLLMSVILALCATISGALLAILGSRYHSRIDLTSVGEFTLSPRTLAAMKSLTEPTTVVVSADIGTLDRPSRQRVADLLDEMSRQSALLRQAWIDTGSAEAPAQFAGLMASLAEPHAEALSQQRAALESLSDECAGIAAALRNLSDGLKGLAESGGLPAPARSNASEQAGLVRTIAAALEATPVALREAASHALGGVALPAVDAARQSAGEPLDRAARAAGAIAEYARALDAPTAATLAREAQDTRDRAARGADTLAGLRATDPLIISRVIEQGSTVILTSSRGAIALDFATLFPQSAALSAEQADARETLFKGEQMISTAVRSLTQPVSPITVFVHAQPARLLDEHGEPTAAALGAFRKLFDRLRLTRTTPAEWAVALDPLRPNLGSLDPAGDRPVVWVVLGAPPRISGDARPSAGDRRTRTVALGQGVAGLIDAGEPVLVCVEPSDLPAIGDPDPIAKAMESFGLVIESARPVLRRESSPQGPMIFTHEVVTPDEASHPIGRAIHGLRVVLPWCSSIATRADSGATFTSLLALQGDQALWGESQWMSLRDLVGRGLARPLAPLLLAEPPTIDAERDLQFAGGTVSVAVAAERSRPAGAAAPRWSAPGAPARCIVVASPEWLHDVYTQAAEEVTGRRVSLFPGNLELFDASLAWLAQRDDEIAAGPRSMDAPRIAPISEGALRGLRLLLIVGLPALPLVIGALLRVVRG